MNIEDSSRKYEHRHTPLVTAVIGLLVLTFGLTLLAGNLGWFDARYVWGQFWPVGLILLGIAVLVQGRADRTFGGVALIVWGAVAFASQHQWLRVSFWSLFGPLLIVVAGLSVIWRAYHRPRLESSGDVSAFALFSGSQLRPTAPFERADLSAMLGGVKLDLTATPMAADEATIDVFTFMGGVEILVPSDWDVTLKVTSLMGGCADKRRPSALPPTKRLIISGTAIMGGVEVKN